MSEINEIDSQINSKINNKQIDIVISRYNEKLDWLNHNQLFNNNNNNKYNIIIYNKGNKLSFHLNNSNHTLQIIDIDNVGRESHTFLYHIIENYNNLADITIFLPGSCMDQSKQSKTEFIINKVNEIQNTVISGKWYYNVRHDLKDFSINTWIGSNQSNQSSMPTSNCQQAIIRPFGRWYFHYFKKINVNIVSFNSIFAISKQHIIQHDKDYYSNLIKCLENHSNPEEGHYMERAWVAVFHPIPESCLFYTKPTRNNNNNDNKSNVITPSNASNNKSNLSFQDHLKLLTQSKKRSLDDDKDSEQLDSKHIKPSTT